VTAQGTQVRAEVTTSSTRRRGLWVVGLAGAAALLAVRDPNAAGSYGFCPLKAATGLDCPFCGGLRASHDLLVGDVSASFDQNLLVPLLAVTAGLWAAVWWFRQRSRTARGAARQTVTLSNRVVVTVVVLLAVFTVARNLPGVPFLGSGIG
jgi:hypothetical protein